MQQLMSIVCLTVPSLLVHAGQVPLKPLQGAVGYPSRALDLDVLPGFRKPPPGYGQVPFWWWTGDPLDKKRLLWQIEALHEKGISGMQVNYAHQDTTGWPTYAAEPEIFSKEWWDVWRFVAGECSRRNMGIGLSGYTIDWPNGMSLVSSTIYSDPEIQGRELTVAKKTRAPKGKRVSLDLPESIVAVRAYVLDDKRITPKNSIDLTASIKGRRLNWFPPANDHEIWVYTAPRKAGTLNPIHPLSGQRVVESFFQRFQENAPDRSPAGLNYFFHDELKFGVGDRIWTDDLPGVFMERKGYDLFEALPAMVQDVGPRTVKYRLDFMDVKVSLAQERYFIPIFEWHWSRGKIYGCDQGSRGRDPMEFGDYFSAVRWYTAPGHDTPGGRADLIKGKVSSSIAHLYGRPRVWLEGYHSLGWSATPARLMQATCENYIYGCNLLNLHGLYYTTHGSFWEWAPPSYHFRMPYWNHMDSFFDYFERLSYIMSQGVHQCGVAILYPVSPGQAGLGGEEATKAAFAAGTKLFENGYDFIFMDHESLDKAEIRNARLHVSDAAYRVLVLPAMRAVRWSTLEKARAFARAGGIVTAIGALPEASDRAGAKDPVLDEAVREIFGVEPGGVERLVSPGEKELSSLLAVVSASVPPDVQSEHPIKATHRKIGPRDVYLLMGARRNSPVTFRAKGKAELWDPWTGAVQPLRLLRETGDTTQLKLPGESYEAQVVVFTPGEAHVDPPDRKSHRDKRIPLDGEWEFELKPTMDNRYGDYRLPIVDPMIGPEARIFRHALEEGDTAEWSQPDFDDSQWERVTHDFGPQFWVLGPLPDDVDCGDVDAELAKLTSVDLGQAMQLDHLSFPWRPYNMSWRQGLRGDPGHQGYHGLKENVTDHFLCLGRRENALNEFKYVAEESGKRYYLWTSATVPRGTPARIYASSPEKGEKPHASEVLTPAAVFLNGTRIHDLQGEVLLHEGVNPLLIRYDGAGRGYFVLKSQSKESRPTSRTPLSMRWFDDPSVVRFDVHGGAHPIEWFRFEAPPGLRAIEIESKGTLEAWADGSLMANEGQGRFESHTPLHRASIVALRVTPETGASGGALLPHPIRLECGPGLTHLGDWSKMGALECFSGGARYGKCVTLTRKQSRGGVILDLGRVVATAEVRVNGQVSGIRVSPPWRMDISKEVKPGENRIEVLVYNTLANHYATIPTRYRGPLISGLLGPVSLEVR